MDERTQGALLLAVGGICLRLGFTDAALAYVKSSMRIPLVLTGTVLIVLGATALLRVFRSSRGAEQDGPEAGELEEDHAALHGYHSLDAEQATHRHTHGPGVAWLLVLPVLALLLIAPPPLGSFAAERQSVRPPTTSETTYGPLPEPVGGAVDLLHSEFIFRALYDPDGSLGDVPVRLTGFVTPAPERDGYLLTRFALNCCAADATALNVRVVGDAGREADTWLEVIGVWEPSPDRDAGDAPTEPPVLRVQAVTPIEAPAQPYEY